jgi:hypothetical protein
MRALVLMGILTVGCGAKMNAAGSALGDCELGKLPNTLQTVIADVAGILLSSGNEHWQTDLTGLGVQVGAQQLDCVVQAVGAGIKGQMRKGKATPEYIEGSRRADEWVARGHGGMPQ